MAERDFGAYQAPFLTKEIIETPDESLVNWASKRHIRQLTYPSGYIQLKLKYPATDRVSGPKIIYITDHLPKPEPVVKTALVDANTGQETSAQEAHIQTEPEPEEEQEVDNWLKEEAKKVASASEDAQETESQDDDGDTKELPENPDENSDNNSVDNGGDDEDAEKTAVPEAETTPADVEDKSAEGDNNGNDDSSEDPSGSSNDGGDGGDGGDNNPSQNQPDQFSRRAMFLPLTILGIMAGKVILGGPGNGIKKRELLPE